MSGPCLFPQAVNGSLICIHTVPALPALGIEANVQFYLTCFLMYGSLITCSIKYLSSCLFSIPISSYKTYDYVFRCLPLFIMLLAYFCPISNCLLYYEWKPFITFVFWKYLVLVFSHCFHCFNIVYHPKKVFIFACACVWYTFVCLYVYEHMYEYRYVWKVQVYVCTHACGARR